jgi:hypothetical protein
VTTRGIVNMTAVSVAEAQGDGQTEALDSVSGMGLI